MTAANDAPQNLTVSGDWQVDEENGNDTTVGTVAFTDADTNDTHQISVNDERFEVNASGELVLKPGSVIDFETVDVIPIQLTITDSAGASATQQIIVQIANVNEAPVRTDQIIEIPTDSSSYTFSIPSNAFFDVDGNPLELSATQADGSELPDWLEFDPATGEFIVNESNTVGAESLSVLLTATDPEGLTASTEISINVAPPPPVAAAQELPAVVTAIEPEVVAAEEVVEEPDEAAPREESFEAESLAEKINIAPEDETLNEVVQINAAQTVTTQIEALRNNATLDVKTHNNFNLISDQSSTESIRTQQQLETINNLSLRNLFQQAELNQSRMSDNQVFETTILATSATLTSSFSVGYILWLLRGGTLIASVMASLPAWRAIDPLPVLEGLTGDDDSDTETLESMVESDEDEPKEPENKAA